MIIISSDTKFHCQKHVITKEMIVAIRICVSNETRTDNILHEKMRFVHVQMDTICCLFVFGFFLLVSWTRVCSLFRATFIVIIDQLSFHNLRSTHQWQTIGLGTFKFYRSAHVRCQTILSTWYTAIIAVYSFLPNTVCVKSVHPFVGS